MARAASSGKRIRYAVVGLGHISQVALLPAMGKAKANSELAALVSGDRTKLRRLGRKYRVKTLIDYKGYDALMASGDIDAVYIGLPNHLHRDFVVRAAQAGVHVLCEKPLGLDARECRDMIRACERSKVRLMVAYRLHFAPSNLRAIEIIRAGALGEIRIFDSVFSMQVGAGNIRLGPIRKGGGTVYDIGIYCINAARYLFRAEPEEVVAFRGNNGQKRFRKADEMTGGMLRFPGDGIATFVSSFGAADVSRYEVVGSKGKLVLEEAYGYSKPSRLTVTTERGTRIHEFEASDQFAPELLHFSECILNGRIPGPAGEEGLADARIIDAIHRSAESGRPVQLAPFRRTRRPTAGQMRRKPRSPKPPTVRADSPRR
ncbi:MAG: Gfo/Idh/MocA family oxidoreductase [Gemmatimonadales bacterium]|nr:Gfo/Idh/MocA family oxidoreductase [Gemmatimonadales bacterium]